MTTTSNELFLDTAAALGRRLVREALWAEDRCNWLGDSMEFVDNNWSVVHRALGPDLYGGTSGIALFLARLYRLTGERLFRVTAEGAMRHALTRLQDIPPITRIAFYSGWVGIAYAMAELSEAFGDGTLAERAFALIGDAARETGGDAGLDVISGSAGAIPALISLRRRYRRDDLLRLATRLGEHLLAAARRGDGGWSWNTLEGQTERDLTGYSHGAAGIACALLELSVETGSAAFREAAERGFAYERQWFNRDQENWPDFRKGTDGAPGNAKFALGWCHGAPGIGLSRVRGYEILQNDDLKSEAEAALRTTSRMLTHPAYAMGDFTLCHGRGGNAELLIYAAQALGDGIARETAEAVGRQGIEVLARNNLPWPCGVPGGGETPNLLLGLAGIGYFYLRLHDPETVPSILIVRPPDSGAGANSIAG